MTVIFGVAVTVLVWKQAARKHDPVYQETISRERRLASETQCWTTIAVCEATGQTLWVPMPSKQVVFPLDKDCVVQEK